MGKLIKFELFILNYYYKSRDGTRDSAYLNAVFGFLLVIFVNIMTVLTILNIDIMKIVPLSLTDPKWLQYLKILIFYFLPTYALVSQLFPKSKIESLSYDDDTIEKGSIVTLVYYIVSLVAAIVVAIIWNGKK